MSLLVAINQISNLNNFSDELGAYLYVQKPIDRLAKADKWYVTQGDYDDKTHRLAVLITKICHQGSWHHHVKYGVDRGQKAY